MENIVDFKGYFKKNNVKLTKGQKRAMKAIGLLTKLQLKYKIPQKEISKLEDLLTP